MDYPSGRLPPRRGPPRRAETLPVRFAGIGTTERIGRREREPSIERERDIIIEPISRRQSSLSGETPRTRAVPIEADRHLSPPAPRRRRGQRSRQRSRRRSRRSYISESEADSRKSASDSNESSDSSHASSHDSYGRRRYLFLSPRARYGRARYGRARNGSSESDREEEPDVNRDTYAFSLPRYRRSPLSQDSTPMGSDPSITSDSQVAANALKLGMAHHVYRSRYTGEGLIGGVQSAELTVIHDPKRGRPPLFRWM
jgi:hypothetical protein